MDIVRTFSSCARTRGPAESMRKFLTILFLFHAAAAAVLVRNDWCYQRPSNGTFELVEDCPLEEEFSVSPYVNSKSALEIRGAVHAPHFILPRIYRRDSAKTFRLFKVVDGKLILENLNMTGGNAGKQGGGAIYVSGSLGTLSVINSVFHANQGGWTGGTIYVVSGGHAILDETIVEGNKNLQNGQGGISCHGSGSTCMIKKSGALASETYDGASIHASFYATVVMEGMHPLAGCGLGGFVKCSGGLSTTPCVIRHESLVSEVGRRSQWDTLDMCTCVMECRA